MKYVIFIIAMAVSIRFLAACKKSTGGVKSMLEAKWKSEQFAFDDNGNKVMDAAELHSTDSLNEYRQFNSDGTGSDMGANLGLYPIPFYWAMSTDNQYLRITDTSKNATIYHIDAISNTQLILRDTGSTILWIVYKKQ